MKRVLLVIALSVLIGVPTFAALKAGEKGPDFSAKASLAGKEFDFSLKSALAKGPVVVYFYPSAYTQGCNIEAHTFSENSEKFAAAKATIIGVSGDSITRLNAFSADPAYCAGKFPVASDPDGRISKSYGLNVNKGPAGFKDSRGVEIDHDFTERTTFVLDRDGKIVATLSSAEDKISPAQHVEKSLEVVQQLAAMK